MFGLTALSMPRILRILNTRHTAFTRISLKYVIVITNVDKYTRVDVYRRIYGAFQNCKYVLHTVTEIM